MYTHTIAGPSSSATPTFARKVFDSIHAMRERRKQRTAIRELRSLDNHTLKDIGLHRTEVTSVICADPAGRRRHHVRD